MPRCDEAWKLHQDWRDACALCIQEHPECDPSKAPEVIGALEIYRDHYRRCPVCQRTFRDIGGLP